jgi:hypothetical protein
MLDRNKPPRFSAAHAEFVRAKIAKCEAELSKGPPASHPQTIDAQGKIDKLKAELASRAADAAKLPSAAKKVCEGLQDWLTRLESAKTSDPVAFLSRDGITQKNLKRMLDDLEGRLSRAGSPEDPDVKEGAALLADAKLKFESAFTDAKARLESIGDWRAELVRLAATCEGRAKMGYHYDSEAQMREWISSLPAIRANIDAIEAYIAKLGATVPGFAQTKESQAIVDALFAEKNIFNQSTGYWENEFVKDIGSADRESASLEGGNIDLRNDGFGVIRRPLLEGLEAARLQALFYAEFKKSPADAQASQAKGKDLEARLAKLEALQKKMIDGVRMPKENGTPELKKIAANVTKGAPFTKWLKGEGSKLLRVVVVSSAVATNNGSEWYLGKLLHRDYDTFNGIVAVKSAKGDVEMFYVEFRFSRLDYPTVTKSTWNHFLGTSYGPILEANVAK